MAATASSSASTSKSDSIDISEAVNHFSQGKRHLLVQDYPSAVSSLQSATEIFAEKYGEMANECGDAYFQYGKALLELARMETGVLGNALDGVPEDSEDSEESNSNKDQVESPNNLSDDDDDDEAEAEAEDKEEDDEKEVTIDKSPENKKGDEENDGNEAENDEDKEEEISNLQLAWEVIELAKVIFERQSENNKEMKLKMADTYLKLGEIAIESGNYQAAEEDLTKCLKIRQNDLEPDDRLIAETHFQLGVAFSFNSEFDKGRSSYEEATKVIKQRISNLENKLKDITDQDQKETLQLEITDLKELIPEINSKVEDTEDMKRNAAKAREEAIKEAISQQKVMFGTEDASTSKDPFADSGFTSSSSLKNGPFIAASPTKPVSNIGHLVRKKRKTDDESSETGSPLKKVCSSTENIISSENNINGTATSARGDNS